MIQTYNRTAALMALILIACPTVAACSEETVKDCHGYCHQRGEGKVAGVIIPEICPETFCEAMPGSCKAAYYVLKGAAAGGDGSKIKPFVLLSSAASKARGGDCVVIGAGQYQGDTFDGGVSLLGTGAGPGKTRIGLAAGKSQTLLIKEGGGGVIRGIDVSSTAMGLEVHNVQGLVLDQVRISDTVGVGLYAKATKGLFLNQVTVRKTRLGKVGKSGDVAMGIVLTSGTEATIKTTFIESNAQLGLIASEAKVEMEGSVVKSNGSQAVLNSHGVVVHCSDKTAAFCATSLSSRLYDVDFIENLGIGIIAAASKLELNKVTVTNTLIGGGTSRGISIQVQGLKTAETTLVGCTISASAGQGLFIDGASATGEDPDPWMLTVRNNSISNNLDRGIWMQNIKSGKGKVLLQDNVLADNSLIGIGLINAKGVQVKGGSISGTKLVPTTVGVGNSVDLGDGLQVMELSEASVESVTFDKNQRLSMLFDQANGSATKNVFTSLKGKPEIVLQNKSETWVKHSDNKDKSGLPVQITVPKVPMAINNKAVSVSSLPSVPQGSI